MSLLTTLLAGAGGGGGGSGSVIGVILAPTVAATTATLVATYANGSSGQGATLTNASSSLTAARVASTTALTVTYSNGTLGVGATLTNNGTQAAISIDSVALSLNDRVLIKNQAAPAQNGVYSVTTVGTGATNWVLTRVTDFDQAAEMIAGTQISITAGTVNTGTKWILSTTVATVGTDAVSFVATAAFAIDGITPAVGSRVLIKDQTSALQNGVYTVTTAGSASVDWVLTRSTDFNQPSQMTAGTLIEVIGGTVNAGTVWELSASVAAVGTNAVTFISINITTKVDQNGSPIYGASSAGTDTYAITLSPAPSAYSTGMVINFKADVANTGNATLNVNGLGAKNILKAHDQTLADNDIEANQIVTVIYDGTQFQMQSQIANTISASGELKSFQFLTSGSSATYTKPAGITSILVEAVGGGAGGGASTGTLIGAGGGGGAGGYVRKWIASASGTYTYTVGAGGASASNGNNTTFDTLTAGAGTAGGTATSSTNTLALGGAGGTSSGGDINGAGAPGIYGLGLSAVGPVSGAGGSSQFGGGGVGVTQNGPGQTVGTAAAANSGGGGAGGANNGGVTVAGGAGGSGLVVVWEFA